MGGVIERDGFFRPGGTLPSGAASYVPRRADDEIFEALVAGEYVYVLDSRQKGKSSLIVRSLDRLHEAAVTTVRVDLQRLGSNVTPDQWYAGLLRSIGQDLGLIAELFEHWRRAIEVGPATRFFCALEEVVLPSVPGAIVVFVDEVDYVRSLPFAADEFFAAIRDCYNRRPLSPGFARLTFCLVGVAAPSQLIENADVTPFNIGRRVELTDFTREETAPYDARLSTGGRDGSALMDRIHHWVSGHPYLTQLIAAKVTDEPAARRPESVDAIVADTLLSEEVRHKEPNLADVERRLLETTLPGLTAEESRSQVLEVYGELLRSDLAPGRQDALLVATLLLSGVAKEERGRIRPRNRVYRTLFNERWRRSNLPDAEARRQRAASVRAAWKVGTVAGLVLASFAGLIGWLFLLADQRDLALAEARRLQAFSARQAYESSMSVASEQIADGGYLVAARLVDGQAGYDGRGWEWAYLSAYLAGPRVLRPPSDSTENRPIVAWREAGSLVEFRRRGIFVNGKALDADLALGGPVASYRLRVREDAGKQPIGERVAGVRRALVDGTPLVAHSRDGKVEVQGIAGRPGITIRDRADARRVSLATNAPVRFLRVSPTGRFVGFGAATRTYDRVRKVWVGESQWVEFNPDDSLLGCTFATGREPEIRRPDGRVVSRLNGHLGAATSLVWFRDGRRIMTSGLDGTVRVWDARTGRQLRAFVGARSPLVGATLSTDEASAVACGADGSIVEWSLREPYPPSVVTVSRRELLAGAVSPDGATYASVGTDGDSALVDIASGQLLGKVPIGYSAAANPFLFGADGSWLVYVTAAGPLLFAEARTGRVIRRLSLDGGKPVRLERDRNDRIVVALGDMGIAGLDGPSATPRYRRDLEAQGIAVSPDGRRIAVWSKQGVVTLVDGKTFATLRTVYDTKTIVRHVEFSHDARWLAVTTASSLAVLCDIEGTSGGRVLSGHASRVWAARFKPDDERLITNSFDGTVRVWDVATAKEVCRMQHPGWVSTAEWSPDGERVVTSCADGNARVFEPRDGLELFKLRGHTGYLFHAAFTPDGKTVVTSGSDGNVRFWRTDGVPTAQGPGAR